MNEIVIIFPNQLFESVTFSKNAKVFLIEEFLFFKQYKFHQQKIAFHRASMKFYADYLKGKGFEVSYIEAHDTKADIRILLKKVDHQNLSIHLYDPVDDWLEKRIKASIKKATIQWYENPLFMTTAADLKTYFDKEKKWYHQTDFYKQQRKKFHILLENGKPKGGKWTYDKENRKRYPKGQIPPHIEFPDADEYTEEAHTYVTEHFKNNYGRLATSPLYPTTFKKAKTWLKHFLEDRFAGFGTYEDSIVAKTTILHHSVLSPLLNSGLLEVGFVLDEAIDAAKKHQIPLNSLEGFVRQILGWREFIRGLYQYIGAQQRSSNFWEHNRALPASFYKGTTGIPPIDETIKKILKTGYAHHIERLMVLSNFMNLCGFKPDDVYQWFMEMFIDAYDWVMVPNVYGMSLFADGGKMSTKPYISSSNYIMKMSDYSKGEWQEIWDGLFWNFIHTHQNFFNSNPRLAMLMKTWERMDDEKKKLHLKTAENFLNTLS
ncbi:cryptochrome/photolyase family protein [Zhouia sp. PK063]|uniref:cryptochrome/photolyase family protein n=1 Tax=Zhouia sp. PK063 TaxID=3373602 RepID=UPI003791903D